MKGTNECARLAAQGIRLSSHELRHLQPSEEDKACAEAHPKTGTQVAFQRGFLNPSKIVADHYAKSAHNVFMDNLQPVGLHSIICIPRAI
jgi:hypothetical protein